MVKTAPIIALFLGLFFAKPAIASCINNSGDSRLQIFCIVEEIAGKKIDYTTLLSVDIRLKAEGHKLGVGLPERISNTTFESYAVPVLEYSSNINGGNPNKDLVLGSLTFKGDSTLLRKKGILAGVGVGSSGRHIYGEGRYLDFNYGASYLHSQEHGIGFTRAFFNLCSKNHVHSNWYLDACVSTKKLKRETADDDSGIFSIGVAKLFSIGSNSYYQANFNVGRLLVEEYEQNQLSFGLSTIHSNGLYTALNATLGADIADKLVSKHSFSATVGATLFNRPLTASYAYGFADGGKLLGFERNDTSHSFNIAYTLHPRFKVSFGYREVNSSIDYFSESEPIFGFQFAPLRF